MAAILWARDNNFPNGDDDSTKRDPEAHCIKHRC